MKKYIEVEADTNDADYISSRNEITDEQIELIKPLLEAIKNFEPYVTKTKGLNPMDWTHHNNYPSGDCQRDDLGELSPREYYTSKGVTEDAINIFDEFIPSSEYGIHTIESVKILEVSKEENLL